MDELYNKLQEFGDIKTNTPFSKLTTFALGGPAQYLVEVKDTQKLVDLLNYVHKNGLNFFILGGGSNLLMPDDGIEGVTIKVLNTKVEMIGTTTIMAEAGAQLGAVVNMAFKNSLAGLEWGVGIPGTVGGAVRGNAGAMGLDIARSISKVEVWRNGEILEVASADCQFGYRESLFKFNGDVVLRTWFELHLGDRKEIMEKVQGYMKHRTGRYPHKPSAGSFFKNIKLAKWPGDIKALPELFQQRGTVPVGWVMEQLDLKGMQIGGARISDEHGNFIVNYENAKQSEILQLVEIMKERAYNKFGVELEEEVEIVK